jgi:hypothetical protein
MHYHIDGINAGNGSLTFIEKRILFNPKHEQKSENGETRDDGLKRDEEASEQEITNKVDVF